jgi:hypothetical protein
MVSVPLSVMVTFDPAAKVSAPSKVLTDETPPLPLTSIFPAPKTTFSVNGFNINRLPKLVAPILRPCFRLRFERGLKLLPG